MEDKRQKRLTKRQKVHNSTDEPPREWMQQGGSYPYQQLGDGYIRVIVIQPGMPDEPLTGHFDTCALEDARYSAISYAWGTTRRFFTMVLEDHHILKVSEAASGALKRLRHPSEQRNVWVDSLCIDQSNLQEKGAQVAMMGQIYQTAEQVLVWLGESETSDAMAFWACHQLAKAWPKWEKATGSSTSAIWKQSLKAEIARSALTIPFYDGHCPCCRQPCHWQTSRTEAGSTYTALYHEAQVSIRRLVLRPYFQRLWPVQEVCMAKSCTVYAGSHKITFNALYGALDLLATLQSQVLDKQQVLAFTYTKRKDVQENAAKTACGTLLDILAATQTLHTQDPRDRIYAVRSLTDTATASFIRPNYEISMVQLLMNIAVGLLSVTKAPAPSSSRITAVQGPDPSVVLSLAAAQRNEDQRESDLKVYGNFLHTISGDEFTVLDDYHRNMKLPSWTPDLAGHHERMWKVYRDYAQKSHGFSAGGRGNLKVTRPESDSKIITIYAKLHTVVSRVYSPRDIAMSYQGPKKPNDETKFSAGQAFDRFCKCFLFAKHSEHFKNLYSASEQEREAAAADTVTFLTQGREVSDDDDHVLDQSERVYFEGLFVDGYSPTLGSAPWQGRPAHISKRSCTPEDRGIASVIYNQGYNRSLSDDKFLASFSNGGIGWVDSTVREGDVVCLLQGAPLPFVLRRQPLPHDDTYENYGDAYVHGIMSGEAWSESEAEWITIR